MSPRIHSSASIRATPAFTLIELLVVIAIIAILASLLFPALARARDKGNSAKCQSNLRQLVLAATMYDEDHGTFPIGWPPASMPVSLIWYRTLQPYLGRNASVAGKGVFICPSSIQKAQATEKTKGLREGGFWGYLAYAQNAVINAGVANIASSNVKDPSGTIIYGETDGWDACLYPDDPVKKTGNVCYRHSGGNERSVDKERVEAGQKKPKRRANGAFVDGHVESLRSAPIRIFTLEND